MDNEKVYQIALGFIPGIGDILTKQLISYCGSASNIFSQPKSKLLKIPGIGEKFVYNFNPTEALGRAEKEYEKCLKSDIDVLFYTDTLYPQRLKRINDSPTIIFTKGSGNLDADRVVSIVGTRNATKYGKDVTEQLCLDMSTLGVTTVSGLAYGIDIYAHRNSLKNSIPTFGVIASGLDIIYPSVHKETSQEMLAMGGLITEHPLGTKPEAHHFPGRNRIIAGLCDALIVIETGEKGGSMITANLAFSYDKDLFAVPGNITSAYSKGCNGLIATQKAFPYTSIDDLIVQMNWDNATGFKSSNKLDLQKFEGEEKQILMVLSEAKDGFQIDQLSWKTQVPINRLASILLNLEFGGVVKSLPGKKFKIA